jgi:CHAT domain-containing protein
VTAADLLAAEHLPMDVVFLSACESGRSEVEGGDELMGLVRAFLLGGTRAVVVSLWRVDELATRVLAELFYQAYIGSHLAAAQALRQAQLAVRTLTWADLVSRLAQNGDPSETITQTVDRLAAMNATWRIPDANCPLAHPYFWAGFGVVGS